MVKARRHLLLLVLVVIDGCASGLLVREQLPPVPFIHRQQGKCSLLYATAVQAPPSPPIADLQTELNAEGLGLCHGILHASGVRRLSDVKTLTTLQIADMGVDSCDRRNLLRVISSLGEGSNSSRQKRTLSTLTDGAFDRVIPKQLEEERGTATADDEAAHDFCMQVVCAENNIFRGRLFTEEQCTQMNRMAEYHSYQGIGTIGAGWTNELYTLTSQHMQCKDIPGLLSTTDYLFKQLQRELHSLFPGRIRNDSIIFESEGEPHLVKYHGKSKGTEMHTDNSKFLSITVNVMLSATDDFGGGGTYIKAIDETINLQQGEMLIHLGDLEHAGVDISSGVRRLLIAFFACEWETMEES
jgi:hypothetical protein